jgi:hypothetical protein
MFEQEVTLFRFMHGYLQNVVAEYSEADLQAVLPGAVNSPGYVLGHLAISNDFALGLLNQPKVCSEGWGTAFGPGSDPTKMQIPYPSKQILLDTIRQGHERVIAAVPQADPVAMAQPQTFPFFRGTAIKTVGDCVALLMTTHFSLHVGQLSLMRRMAGYPPLF